MRRFKKVVVEYYTFYCPGCKHEHTYTVKADGSQWQFNGNMLKPSFTPSLLNREFNTEAKLKSSCHLFVTDGKIIFCDDCTHEFAGKTVELDL